MSGAPLRFHWQPLLTGDLGRRARLALEEIAEDLRHRVEPPSAAGEPTDFSLARGQAGQALFFAYLDRVLPGRGYADLAVELLERAAGALANRDTGPGLYSGFAGVCWVAEHFHGWLLDVDDDADPLEGILAAIVEHLGQTPWRRHFDLIGGLVGFGLLGLERHPRAGAVECVELVTARLAELAERHGEGLAWLTPPALLVPEAVQMTPQGQYDLGVAHGVPGIVGFLAGASTRAASPEARDLLSGAVRWILSCKRPARGSLFPYHVAPGSDLPGSRLAWCYGDPGIAAVLLAAARHVGEPSWEREALATARLAAARRWPSSGVRDSCLCHGAAGVAHLFNRLFQASREPDLAEAARYWFEWTLGDRKPGRGCAGFLHSQVNERREEEWIEEPGFLMGSAGIGLALIAALFPVEPAWDRLLLASIPGPTAPAA